MVRGFWGHQGGSGQTSQNGHFGPFRPFWGVCPELPWSPQNPFILLNYSLMVPLKHMTVWRHFHFWKCEILRMAAHFSPSCLGLMGKFCSSVDLLFQVLFKFFFHRWVTGGLTQLWEWLSCEIPIFFQFRPPYYLGCNKHTFGFSFNISQSFCSSDYGLLNYLFFKLGTAQCYMV